MPMDFLIWLIGTLLGATWRITVNDPHRLRPYDDRHTGRIYCFWHAHLLALAYIFRNTGKTALASASRDGRLAALTARRWKHEIIFGSSSRGGNSAMRECIRALKERRCIIITPDGPRGPREKVKTGVAQIAMVGSAPVVAVRLHADRSWRLRSWDRFMVPKPFARVTVTLCAPLFPPPDAQSDESVECFCKSIDERLSSNDAVAS
ncbi:MAG: lysophospholipid acyltransferase family protein [Chitinispirillaceae bacterium]|nr:lysophospholipid acyltransferase family protein [Chitinispirillaceae bacterium]